GDGAGDVLAGADVDGERGVAAADGHGGVGAGEHAGDRGGVVGQVGGGVARRLAEGRRGRGDVHRAGGAVGAGGGGGDGAAVDRQGELVGVARARRDHHLVDRQPTPLQGIGIGAGDILAGGQGGRDSPRGEVDGGAGRVVAGQVGQVPA